MKKIVIISITLLIVGLFFTNCKNETDKKEEAIVKKEDTVNVVNLNATSSPIAPPDKDYTGDYVDKYPNGVIRFTGFFRFGKRHGQWLAFYENGIKWSECYYDNDKKDGQSTVYFPNGNIQYTGWYKQDLQDSLWFFYDIDKKEIDRRAYRKGVETGLVN